MRITSLFFSLLFFGFTVTLFAAELPDRQKSVADQYSQLEKILQRLIDVTASSNPERASLLKKTLESGKDKLVQLRLERIAQILEQRQLTDAITEQEGIEKDLLELLKLLENENRDQKRAEEKEKIKQFLRDIEELIHQEKDIKGRTAQIDEIKPLGAEQKEIHDKTESLRQRIDDFDNPTGDKPRSENPRNESSNEPNNAAAPPKPEEQEKEEQEQKIDSKTETGSPTHQAMQRALKRMQRASDRMKKSEKEGSLEDQEEAIAELQRAKAELEKILRQLREEELMATLEKLEARLKRMLRIEQAIRSQTEKLIPKEEIDESTGRQLGIQSNRLAADQQSVIIDADAALVLLRDDGTAQAMTESLLQTRLDMEEIKQKLEHTELNTVTIQIEDAVIEALQEMLDAVQQAIKEAEKRKEDAQKGMPPNAGGQNVEPLLQLLSELRMIRSMQKRVNDRTERYEKEVETLKRQENNQQELDQLRLKVEELARQQNRISRILHDLKIGKTE